MVVKYGLEVFIDNPNFIIQTFAGPLVFGLLLSEAGSVVLICAKLGQLPRN